MLSSTPSRSRAAALFTCLVLRTYTTQKEYTFKDLSNTEWNSPEKEARPRQLEESAREVGEPLFSQRVAPAPFGRETER